MRIGLAALALLSICFLGSCSEKVDKTPPEAPLLVPHSPETDTLPVEVGTDAVPECNCIVLEWVRNTEEDLKEYEVFRSAGDSLGFVSLTVVPGGESSYVDRNLQLIRYYYYMVAKDELGNESDRSGLVDYRLTSKALPASPAKYDTVMEDSVMFEWTWDGGLEGVFLTRLFSYDLDSTIWMGWTNAYERPLRVSSPPVARGDYKWRVDYIAVGRNEGSESNWIAFYAR